MLTEQIKGTFVQEESTVAAVKIPKSLFQLNTIFLLQVPICLAVLCSSSYQIKEGIDKYFLKFS